MKNIQKYNFKVITCLVIFILLGQGGWAQYRSNPFEIKPRLKNLNLSDTISVQPARDTAATSDTSLIIVTTVDTISKNKESNSSARVENPFDVDHIKLKKSALAKRSEKLELQVQNTQISNRFLFWFLLLSCAILAVVLNMKSKSLNLIFRSILNENMLRLFQREESVKASGYLILLYGIFIINFSIILYLTYTHYGGHKGILIFTYILAGTGIMYVTKHLSLMILGNIFMLSKSTGLYSFTVMIFNLFIGIILLPVNFLASFGPDNIISFVLIFTTIFLALMLFVRTFRGIFIVSEYFSDRIFQIFIYLCAFEVAPVLILIRTVLNLTN